MGKGEQDAIQALGLNAQSIMDMINAGGTEASKAYEMVNVALASVSSETERTSLITALYGTQSEDVGKRVTEAMMSASGAIGDTTGAAEQLNNTVSSSPAQQFTAQWNTLKESLIPLGTELMKIGMEILPVVSSAIEGVSNFLGNMSPTTQKVILVVGGLVGGLGALLIAIAPIVSTMGTLIPIFAKVGTAIAGIGTPIGWVIGIVGGLIAIGVALYKNWDEIVAFGEKSWGAITGFIGGSIETAQTAVSSGMDWISDKFTKVTGTISTFASKGFKEIGEFITNPIGKAREGASKFLDLLDTKFGGIGTSIKGKVKSAFNEVKDFITNPIETARDKVSTAIDKIKGFFTNLSLKIPSIELPKMPKIDLKWSSKTFFGKEISYPSGFDIKWNAKGGVFTKPTILNSTAGLQGVAEAGYPEAILPLNDTFYSSLASNLVKRMQGNTQQNTFNNHFYIQGKANHDEIARAQKRQMEQMGYKYR